MAKILIIDDEKDLCLVLNRFLSKHGYQVIEANKNTNKDLPLVDSAWLADVTVYSNNGTTYKAQPALFSKDNLPIAKRDTVMSQNLVLQVNKIGNAIALGVKESNAVMKYITLKAFQFPFINILWLGILIMSAGFFCIRISNIHRIAEPRPFTVRPSLRGRQL